jgi:hypothetical protein
MAGEVEDVGPAGDRREQLLLGSLLHHHWLDRLRVLLQVVDGRHDGAFVGLEAQVGGAHGVGQNKYDAERVPARDGRRRRSGHLVACDRHAPLQRQEVGWDLVPRAALHVRVLPRQGRQRQRLQPQPQPQPVFRGIAARLRSYSLRIRPGRSRPASLSPSPINSPIGSRRRSSRPTPSLNSSGQKTTVSASSARISPPGQLARDAHREAAVGLKARKLDGEVVVLPRIRCRGLSSFAGGCKVSGAACLPAGARLDVPPPAACAEASPGPGRSLKAASNFSIWTPKRRASGPIDPTFWVVMMLMTVWANRSRAASCRIRVSGCRDWGKSTEVLLGK